MAIKSKDLYTKLPPSLFKVKKFKFNKAFVKGWKALLKNRRLPVNLGETKQSIM